MPPQDTIPGRRSAGRPLLAHKVLNPDGITSPITRLPKPDATVSRNTLIYRRQRTEMIAAYGGCCVCCGETEPVFLTIDHINGDGGYERKQGLSTQQLVARLRAAGWPKDRYRLLCFNCNMAMARGGCPHQRLGVVSRSVQDARTRERAVRADYRPVDGEGVPIRGVGGRRGTKLTWKMVCEIRARFAAGGVQQQDLAREYGLHPTYVCQIINYKRWKMYAAPSASP